MILFQRVLLVTAVLAMSACASGPQPIEYASGTDAQAKLVEVRARRDADLAKQYDQLSPDRFEGATNALAKAQSQLNEGASSEKILEHVGKAEAGLALVEANAAAHSAELTPVLAARRAALDAGASRILPDQFAEADGSFHEFGRDIEKGKFKPEARDLSKLEAKYSLVELNTIKKDKLGEAFTFLKRAEDKRDGKDKAPITFKEAQVGYDSALRAIEASRRDPSAYQGAVDAAIKSTRKLDQVLTTMERTKATELAAVQIYNQQQQLAATSQELDRTRTEAKETLDQTKAQAQQSLDQATTEAREAQARASALQGQNQVYAGQAALNARIESVKAEFKPEEAEVLRDGNKIILRLKSMKFSTARYELTQSSLGTLHKVKDMIAAMPVARVTVEGHTDNVGGEKKNQSLSESRAETVKKYLVAENAVDETKIESQGFGYQKPLTSNKTAQGRATNRRVDVIIESADKL